MENVATTEIENLYKFCEKCTRNAASKYRALWNSHVVGLVFTHVRGMSRSRVEVEKGTCSIT